MSVFESFEHGTLYFEDKTVDLSAIPWSPHASFAGVALKHLVTAQESGGAYSFHLVKVDPNMVIGLHDHATQVETHEVVGGSGVCNFNGRSVDYEVGTIGIMPVGVAHEVLTGDQGIMILAKFFPALL